jgi:predicted NAD-dependent protein-ADP-ribosyltransferase YbiA (DUF1768 family)
MSQHLLSRIFLIFVISCAFQTKYPDSWWKPVPYEGAPSWEILPQAAKPRKEVILSKRNELGILSNFAATPFYYNGKRYASVEGFWQMMKYPDPEYKNDPRSKNKFPFTREQVAGMSSFEAKSAGDKGDAVMKSLKIDWVTFEGEKMTYCSEKPRDHFYLIKEAMIKKLRYNPEVRRVLLATGNLKLKPDHHEEECTAPEWKYYELWMDIRQDVMRGRILAPIMLIP